MTTADAAPTAGPETSLGGETTMALFGAGFAVTAWSTGTILAKYIDMDPLAIGIYRFSVFFIVLATWMTARGARLRPSIMRHSAIGGVALGADIALFFTAVKLTSVVNATVIGSLQPVIVGVLAVRFFGEKIRGSDAVWALLAVAAAVAVVLTGNPAEESSWRGDLLAVGALVSWSAYFIASKQSRGTLTAQEFTLGTAAWTAIICLPIGLAFDQDLSWPSATNWAWLAVMILSAGVAGHTVMNWSLQRIPVWVGSTFTLFIPVASALLAWALLGEPVTAVQAVAMAAVIGALAIIVRNQRADAGA
ncbi:MAG: DMT family transporter [Acidimicrobiales bacterium]